MRRVLRCYFELCPDCEQTLLSWQREIGAEMVAARGGDVLRDCPICSPQLASPAGKLIIDPFLGSKPIDLALLPDEVLFAIYGKGQDVGSPRESLEDLPGVQDERRE